MDGLARRGDPASRGTAPRLDQLSEIDVLLFPGQELGNLVDAEALELIPNDAVLPPLPSDRDDAYDQPAVESLRERRGE